MAINSLEICNKIKPKYSDSINSFNSSNSVSNITKITVTTEDNISASSKCKKSKNQYSKSPYLKGDKVQLLSRVTEKRLIHKLEPNYVSSFPLAATIYRVNSDEIRPLKRSNKKNKKSVLTLPNEQSRLPETCTVSEMNDSEYCNRDDKNKKTIKKKRTPLLNKRKSRKNNFEFYDRDARYCSQMNIDLDCSSSDILNQFNGDGRKLSKKSSVAFKPLIKNECNAHDVWTVLRNINRFQFRPSPPMSNDSNRSPKKKKYINRRRNNRKDARVIETCRTEEIAYISSYDIDSKSATNFSPLSSCDRVTVIDKQGEFSKIGKEFENKIDKLQNTVTPTNNMKNRNLLRNNIFGTKSMKGKEKENKISNQLVPIGIYNGVETHIDNLKLNVSQDHKVALGTEINMATDNSMSYNSDQLSLYVSANNTNNLNNTKKNKQKTHKSVELVDSFMYSEHTGSSKAGLHSTVDYRRDKNKLDKVSSDESSHDTKAITRVVPNKNSNIVVSRNRKPRLVTTMPTTSIVPKLTQTDIKRRLMNLKYPITILGKDQLSSSPINLENYEQFQGLDHHIWPFMVDWYDQNTVNVRSDNKLKHSLNKVESVIQRNNQILRSGGSVILTRQTDREVFLNNANNINGKMIYNLDDSLRKKKIDYQPNATIETTNNTKLSQIKNIKTMRQLKDKMLKHLYKKSSTQSMTNNNYQQIGGQGDEKSHNNTNVSTKVTIRKKVDASTETILKYNEIFPITPSISSQLLTNLKRPLNTNYPWAKGKRTSDLIENVIKNIKNGIYYNQENIETVKSSCVEFKEASVQTTMVALRIGSTNTINKEEKTIKSLETAVLNSETDNFQHIHGFDTALPSLEIKTLNTKEIAVKHCITNVMIQFDVTIPIEQDTVCLDVRKSFSFIPLKVTDRHTRVYKSKTTILNAMLPAELCCIIPKMISNISNVESKFTFSSALLDKTESQLSTISELIHCENPDVFKTFIPSSINVSTKLEKIFTGYFAKPFKSEIKKVNYTLSYNINLATELLDVLQVSSMFPCMLKRLTPEKYSKQKQKPNSMLKTYVETPPKKSSCSTLQPYVASKHSLIQNSAMNNFINILTKIWNYNKFKNYNIISENDGKMIYLPFAINNLKIDAFYNSILKYNNKALKLGAASYYTTPRCIEYKPQEKKECFLNRLFYNKGKKKHFIKLYRKCKSTSNISAEKSTTSLCKIANIDDFFQALGSGKLISNVFDGSAAKKILSCVIEMKNWITEISQRQAMLILLLINKKDTPILVRFRPVLLQGIAVNRITRVSELDMEIEVIERENFNKLSDCEGISYLTPSIENHDNLLEELYWIAKTTASDYQRPFDESSERLLKSLLEKRKKLNPSYLRVMARYVGLGLLKSPNKK
ncbi:uncharacterized protein LOC113510824 [Galleria mellonella]|uniref:Uncharacterized protein LOC113510824 n=1 Tax=Galleria mellonella TaxID=7137 RepID=A0A6J3BTK6_GALME|nr:uncharacterized protein LOC113510824 [Galleria mellonella]